MLCGIHQSTGKVYVEPCLRDDLLKLQAGVGPFLIPDDKHGGTMAIILEAHFLHTATLHMLYTHVYTHEDCVTVYVYT